MVFRFSLDPVLRVRMHQEKLQQQKLAAEVQKQEQIRGVRREIQTKLNRYLNASNGADASRVHDMKRHGSHLEQVHRLILDLDEELNEMKTVVHREQLKLAEIHKNRHILEKVREGELQEHRKKVGQIEQKTLDEVASRMHYRRASAQGG